MKNKIKSFFILFLFYIFTFVNTSFVMAETITMTWLNEDETTYQTTTCNAGDDVILPITPTKRGYTFMGWEMYTPLEYIESTGTQYMETELKTSLSTEIEAEIAFATTSTTQMLWAYGRGGSTNSNITCYFSSGGNIRFGDKVATGSLMGYVSPDVFVNVKQNNTGVYINNARRVQYSATNDFASTGNMTLLWTTNSSASGFIGKIKWIKISQNGGVVLNLIPVLDLNNIPCMYDKIEHKFYYNVGTGDFTAGPIITE